MKPEVKILPFLSAGLQVKSIGQSKQQREKERTRIKEE